MGEPFLREIEWKEKTYSDQGIAGRYAAEGWVNGKELSIWIVPDQENIVIPAELVEELNVQRGVKIKIGTGDNATTYFSTRLKKIQIAEFIAEDVMSDIVIGWCYVHGYAHLMLEKQFPTLSKTQEERILRNSSERVSHLIQHKKNVR